MVHIRKGKDEGHGKENRPVRLARGGEEKKRLLVKERIYGNLMRFWCLG